MKVGHPHSGSWPSYFFTRSSIPIWSACHLHDVVNWETVRYRGIESLNDVGG